MVKEIKESEFEKEVLNEKKVLVDFYAVWCGPCKMLRPVLEDLSKSRTTKIVSVNVDEASDLARKYGIMSIPCLILFENGQEIKRSIGLKSKSELESMID